jgi:hypothetical protein
VLARAGDAVAVHRRLLGVDAGATRAALLDIVERHGGLDDVLAKRAKAPY